MGGSSEQPKVPAAPDYAKLFQQGIEIYLANLPKVVDAEQQTRSTLDPQRIADQQRLQDQFGSTQYRQQLDALGQLDPESRDIRKKLAGMVSSDLDAGYTLGTDYDRELTSQIRGAQTARGNTLGTSAAGAESAFKGKAALDLYQSRLANAGAFLSGPTPEQQLLAVQGVSPDRSLSYVNPSAGAAGANFGLANYQNMLAQYQLSGNQGGGNVWQRALRGASIGASQGAIGGPWGAIGGAAGGAIDGAINGPIYQAQTNPNYTFSDERLKTDIKNIAVTKGGFPLIRFRFIGSPKTYIGTSAQAAHKIKPEAVTMDKSGYLRVDYSQLPGVPYFELGGN